MFCRLTIAFLLLATSIGISLLDLPTRDKAVLDNSKLTTTPTPSPAPADPYAIPKDANNVDISDPWDLQTYIDGREEINTQTIWERLGIENAFNGLSQWKQPKNFLSVCNYCHADLFPFHLDDEPGDEVLLRVANSMEECRYLLFKRINDSLPRYHLIGTIDHSFGRYEMPNHYFVVGGGRSFLAVKVQTESGSGVAMYMDRLFTIFSGHLVELSVFPHEGHQEMWWHGQPMGRTFAGKIADIRRDGNSYIIEIGLTVSYDTWIDSTVPMWTKKQKATFRWALGQSRAVFVPGLSTVSKHELESVYNVDTLADRDFEQFNEVEIREYLRHHKFPSR